MSRSFFIACLLLSSSLYAGESPYQRMLDELRSQHDIPGVSATIIYQGDTLYTGGSGVTDIAASQPATADSVYYIGSITKVLTTVLALHLVEEERIALDEPVRNIEIAGNQSNSRISIRHLLTHTSGLDREGDFSYWFNAEFPDSLALSSYLAKTSLRSRPGRRTHYSNIGFAAIGAAISNATDLSFHDALQQYVLEPLGMDATGSPGPIDNIARGYSPRNTVIPDENRPFAGLGVTVGDRRLREYHDAKSMTPAFGAYSTVRDLGKLAAFLLGNSENEVLSLNMRARMRQRQTGGRGLGLGLERSGTCDLLTHGGWFAAHRSQLLLDATNSIAIVVIANSDNARPRSIVDSLYKAVLDDTGNEC